MDGDLLEESSGAWGMLADRTFSRTRKSSPIKSAKPFQLSRQLPQLPPQLKRPLWRFRLPQLTLCLTLSSFRR